MPANKYIGDLPLKSPLTLDELVELDDGAASYSTKLSDIKSAVLSDIDTTQCIAAACSDETTPLSVGTSLVTFRMPYKFNLLDVRASLTTAQTSGSALTVDINMNGTTILGSKLVFDNTEKTTVTASTPTTIAISPLTDDSEITVDLTQVGDGTATGLKIELIGVKA